MLVPGLVPVKWRVGMEIAVAVHLLVKPIVGCLQRSAQLLKADHVGAGSERIHVGDGTLDLLQHGDGVLLVEDGLIAD